MIALFTDFGWRGPYLGQVTAALQLGAPGVPIVNLMADAPAQDPRAAAYLLPAVSAGMPAGTVLLCVVDPGVGTQTREPVALLLDGRWYVGPDNGLFELAMRRAQVSERWVITWEPESLASTFHGRDLFGPIAAGIARGEPVRGERREASVRHPEWPDDLPEVIYIDHFGNAFTGLRGSAISRDAVIEIQGLRIGWAATFGSVPACTPFWYENSSGLVEIAVNSGRADSLLSLVPGTTLRVVHPGAAV